MKEFFFQNILIADISKKVAKWQQFTKGLNVVTGIDNHVGKSSLLKSLFYALGADVAFDSAWDQNSKLYVATINVNGNTYRIARFSGRFAVFHDEELLIITDRISSELAPLLERIFEFAVYLPNKDTKKVELAPPTFTFMPYYIDQDRGWSGLYNSFKSVARYKSNDRIKSLYYHLSIYTKTTVELMSRKDNLTEQIQSLDKSRERLQTILSALQEETKSLLPAENVQELEVQLTIPKKRIEDLVSRLGQARNEIQEYEAELIQHQHRLEVVSEYRAIKKKDAPKQIVQPETLFSCPHCGYIFDEELFNMVRANYSAVNEEYLCQQIQFIISSTQKKLESVKSNYVELMSELRVGEKVMKAELIYLWINQDGHGCFHQEGFNFSPRYRVSYKYPYLALSMYNLIPCCSICNGLKRDVDTCQTPIVYPYKDSYGRQVSFEAASRESDDITVWLGAAEEYQIKIKYSDEIDPELKCKIGQAVTLFKLEDLYSKHSDYIRDILRTAYIYNDDYFEGLAVQYSDLFHSKQEAQDFVFFNYLDEADWGKRILAKLTHDIVEEAIG